MHMSDTVDLRSDCVTPPTEEMYGAIYSAKLGEDAWREDATVNELERHVAELANKESAVFCPSATMGNLMCVLAQARRGDHIAVHPESHMYVAENSGARELGGLNWHLVPGPRGGFDLDRLTAALRGRTESGEGAVKVVCVENTHQRAGGIPQPLDHLANIQELAAGEGASVHMDGTRVFNAAVAQSCSVGEILEMCDTAVMSLSKGLGAPSGAVVVGPERTLERAREIRKMLGGGQHKVGILAAAGRIALTHIPDLDADHTLAKMLASGIRLLLPLRVPSTVETNIVLVDVTGTNKSSQWWLERLSNHNIRVKTQEYRTLRLMTHKGITKADVDRVIGAFSTILGKLGY